jgi:hypothetical protein
VDPRSIADIILRFVVDKNSQKAAQEAVNQVETGVGQSAIPEIAQVSGEQMRAAEDAIMVSKQLGISAEQAAEMMADGYRMTSDQIKQGISALQEMEKTAKNTGAAVEKATGGGTKSITGQTWRMGIAGFTTMMAGMTLERWGTSLLSPVQDYIKYAGMASETSREWANSMDSIHQSGARIGQSMAQSVLPLLERGAKLLEQIADFFEKHPIIGSALAGVGLGAIATGQILVTLGQVIAGIAALKSLAALPFMQSIIGGVGSALGGGGALAALISPLGLLTAAIIGLTLLLNTEFGKRGTTAGGQMLAMAARGTGGIVGTAIGDPDLANKWFYKVGEALGVLGDKAEEASDKLMKAQAVESWIQYQTQIAEAEQQYIEDRAEIIKTGDQAILDSERAYEKDRVDIIQSANEEAAQDLADFQKRQARDYESYVKTETRSFEDYYKKREDELKKYNRELQKLEADHQREMRRLMEAHNDKVADLLDAQDALGLWRENRNYSRQRRDAEEEYQARIKERNQQLADRLADMEYQYTIERQRSREEWTIRVSQDIADFQEEQARKAKETQEKLAQLDADHKAEVLKMKQQESDKLKQLDTEHQKDLAKRQAAFNDQLRQLDANLLGETTLKNDYYAYQTEMLQKYIDTWKGQLSSNLPGYPAQASGGYLDRPGLFYGGEAGNEFVRNHSLVGMAERAAGGRLSSSKVAALIMRGAGGGQATVNQSITFHGEIGAGDKIAVRKIARESGYQGVLDALGSAS